MKKIISLVGARPQFVKEALVGAAARQLGAWEHILVHSGQHYDAVMSDVFFEELAIPAPKYHLGVGSGTHASMTAAALVAVEKVLLDEKPDALLVYGDTNTTLAGALAAAKLHIPVVHVEAGIRQEPKTMPEEINRVLTDHVSSLFCCRSQSAADCLATEGKTKGVHVTGDVMYDLFLRMQPRFYPEKACSDFGLAAEGFLLATLHRDFNVDNPDSLRAILSGLKQACAATGLPLLLPLHPRTRQRVKDFGLEELLAAFKVTAPIGYLDLMSLTSAARAVITDSGGLQKEAYYAGKRSVVLMPDTGWRELTDCGWNILCAPEAQALCEAVQEATLPAELPRALYGNGQAAQEVVGCVAEMLKS